MERGDIFLSAKEAKRVFVIEQVLSGKLTVRQAAQLLGLSERQVKRLKGGMQKEGVAFLAHKNRGRKPSHAVPKSVCDKVIQLAQNEYRNASCEHMAELLAQYQDIVLSARTVRRILTKAGVHNPHSHKTARRRRSRDRMPKEGLLVQCDASPFDWLEGRGPKMSLHGAIDDATGKILGLYFRLQEDTMGYLHVLWQVLNNHGVPHSLYSDRHTIFFSPKTDKLSIEEELAGKKVPLTQFGRALDELGIIHIPARSPQAKGRVERLWGTLQHRLVIELRLAGISTLEEANALLPEFIARFNARFATEPADPEPAFRPAPSPQKLMRIICLKEERKASNGSTISYGGRSYQLIDSRGIVALLRPRSKVVVLTHLDGSLSALYQDRLFALKFFCPPSIANTEQELGQSKPQHKTPHGTKKPAPDHPWRRTPRLSAKRVLEPIDYYLLDKLKQQF